MAPHHRLEAVLLLVLAAVSGGCERAAPTRRLTVLLATAPVTRDPSASFDELTDAVLGNAYQTVASPVYRAAGEDGGVVDSWTNPDVYTWDLSLRSGLTFHDGKPVQAEDVAAMLNRLMVGSSSPFAPFLQDVVSVRVLDPRRVRVVTSVPLDLMSRLSLIPLMARQAQGSRSGVACGSGPYHVVSWRPERRIVMRRVAPAPPDRHPPDEVEFLVVPDAERQRHLLASVRPVLGLVVNPEVSEAAADLGLTVISVATSASSYIVCNVRPGHATADLKVRRAVAAAVDRSAVTRALGRSQKPADDILAAGVFGYVAGRYAPQASWLSPDAVPGDELHMVVMDTVLPVGEAVADQLRAHGFKVALESRPVQQAIKLLTQGDYDLSVIGYSCTTGNGIELFEFVFTGSGGDDTWNLSGYRSPRVSALVDEAKASTDPAAQHQALVALGDAVLSDLPWIPLLEVRRSVPVSDDVSWQPPPDGRFRLMQVDLR